MFEIWITLILTFWESRKLAENPIIIKNRSEFVFIVNFWRAFIVTFVEFSILIYSKPQNEDSWPSNYSSFVGIFVFCWLFDPLMLVQNRFHLKFSLDGISVMLNFCDSRGNFKTNDSLLFNEHLSNDSNMEI